MLGSVFKVCRLVTGVIALALLLQYGLPGYADAAMVAPDRHLSHLSTVAPASHDAPCAKHDGVLAVCCFGSGCTVAGMVLPPVSPTPISARSAPGYAMPASEHRGGIARIPGLHPPRRAA